MLKQRKYQISGLKPLITHNIRLADPLDELVRDIKKLSSKTKKTDDDLAKIADLEWTGGLYLDEKGRVIMPSRCIEACLVDAAKATRRGKLAKSILVDDDVPLRFPGDRRSVEALRKDANFRFRCMVNVGGKRVPRVRPRFPQWQVEFLVEFETEVWNEDDLDELVRSAGRRSGLCEMRPRYGRFIVESVEDLGQIMS